MQWAMYLVKSEADTPNDDHNVARDISCQDPVHVTAPKTSRAIEVSNGADSWQLKQFQWIQSEPSIEFSHVHNIAQQCLPSELLSAHIIGCCAITALEFW